MEKDGITLQQQNYQHYQEGERLSSTMIFIVSIAFIILQEKSNVKIIKK